MFIVKAIETGKCLICDRESEGLDVEAPEQKIAGLLCLADFKRLIKAATAATPTPMPRGQN